MAWSLVLDPETFYVSKRSSFDVLCVLRDDRSTSVRRNILRSFTAIFRPRVNCKWAFWTKG